MNPHSTTSASPGGNAFVELVPRPLAPPSDPPTAPFGPPLAELTVAADTRLARDVRAFTREHLVRMAADRDTVADAVLLTCELYANALQHAPDGAVVLRVLHDRPSSTFTVSVDDTSRVPPAAADCRSARLQESGRGLALVADLALAWGWHPIDTGKRVWFSMSIVPIAQDSEESSCA
ncbi:ATP-binding protein (plasmid) [Embleya sp. NBC_00888]|uniref:ATP-binding protein n=1 Tax=Embleya sp. NBC_00888 TaxID=2975960 RepID=UPI002F90D780|nr:ATP-binding protein [Embleya sp. NBC_00888]